MLKKAGLILLVVIIFITTTIVWADENLLKEIERQLADLKKQSESLSKNINTRQQEITKLNQELDAIKTKTNTLAEEIIKKERQVNLGEKTLDYQRKLLNERARSYYKNSNKNALTLLSFITADNLSQSMENVFYQKTVVDEDRKTIIQIVLYIKNLEERKKQLENEKIRLSILQKEVDRQSQQIKTELAKDQQSHQVIQQQIASLTAQQRQILAQKLADLNIPHSAGTSMTGCTDDREKDPGFSPRFAFFTFGIPHRVGMNQWGAYGRARSGQDYKTILNAYYNNVRIECRNFPDNKLNVQGYGSVNLHDYLKGLGEMPESWGNDGAFQALKAQVVAAASYAFAYTNGGSGEICTTQNCQVYLGHNKGGRWDDAVNEVKSNCGDGIEVMVSNDTNEVIKAWYASTFGGYTWTSGEVWDSNKPWTKHSSDLKEGVGSLNELRDSDKSYDKPSPYFYCDWGNRREYNKTAWLKPEELADIANALALAKRDNGVISHLAQPDKPNPDGTDTWDREKVKNELRSRGGSPINAVTDVGVDWDSGAGRVTTVRISGDGSSFGFDGREFKDFFNLRAPANIQIVGQLYNIERR